MAQTMKKTHKPHVSATVPVIVMAEPSEEERGGAEIQTWLPSTRLVPRIVPVEVDKLKANIHDFILSMEPVTASLAGVQSDSMKITSLALALSVGANGEVGFPGLSASAQVEASITVTITVNK